MGYFQEKFVMKKEFGGTFRAWYSGDENSNYQAICCQGAAYMDPSHRFSIYNQNKAERNLNKWDTRFFYKHCSIFAQAQRCCLAKVKFSEK